MTATTEALVQISRREASAAEMTARLAWREAKLNWRGLRETGNGDLCRCIWGEAMADAIVCFRAAVRAKNACDDTRPPTKKTSASKGYDIDMSAPGFVHHGGGKVSKADRS